MGLPLNCVNSVRFRSSEDDTVTKYAVLSVSVFIDADYSGFTNQIVKEQREQVPTATRCESSSILPATGVNHIRTGSEVNGRANFFGEV